MHRRRHRLRRTIFPGIHVMIELPPVERVRALLGPERPVTLFATTTATSADAALAIGCEISQIAKSLVFCTRSNRPVLVVASGGNRVDERKVRALTGEKVATASASFVLETTGFPIGGVAPIGHLQPIEVLLDADLMDLPVIWAAAGAPNAVFRTSPEDLQQLTGGRFVDIAKLRV